MRDIVEKKKILIVDDDPAIREYLAQLISTQYQILLTKDGAEALRAAQQENPALILLDILMPGKNGIEICQELRKSEKTRSIPVVMLTALNEPEQRIDAFRAGADDFIAKPFLPDELLARIDAKMRRIEDAGQPTPNTLKFGDLTLNFLDINALVGKEVMNIGTIEFKILSCLVLNKGRLVSRETLHDYVWGSDLPPSDRALDPHITTLRKKLTNSRSELKTVYGQGYCIVLKASDT